MYEVCDGVAWVVNCDTVPLDGHTRVRSWDQNRKLMVCIEFPYLVNFNLINTTHLV